VIKLLARLYAQLGDWERLAELIPELRRRNAFESERLEALERAAQVGRIGQADHDEAALERVWGSLSRRMRWDSEVVHEYVQQLVAAGAHHSAEKRIRQYLNKVWSESLARDYGLARSDSPERQLGHAETWRGQRANSPMLQLTLGRLCVRNRLWDKARSYFEWALELDARAETYYELASLLDELGEIGAARAQERLGLRLAGDADSQGANDPDAEHGTGGDDGSGTAADELSRETRS
jgi:HemY protein